MNQTRIIKRFTAFLLALTMLFGSVPLEGYAEEAPGAEAEQLPGEEPASRVSDPMDTLNALLLAGDDVTHVVYHEVTLALPAGEGPEEKEITTMEDTVMVPHGDPISSIAIPERKGCIFTGWYYDEDLTMAAGEEDTVEANLTLYPRFREDEDLVGDVELNFMSGEDLAPDAQIVLVSYGLTAEEAAPFIQVRDITEGDEEGDERSFFLTTLPRPEEPPFSWEDMDLPVNILEQAKALADIKKQGMISAARLWETLGFLEIEEDKMDRILKEYAGTEKEQAEIAQAKEDAKEQEREALLEDAKALYPDTELTLDNTGEREENAKEFLNQHYQELLADGREEVTYTDIAKAIGLPDAEEEGALLKYLAEDLYLGENAAIAILNDLGVEEETEAVETDRFVVFPEEGAWTEGHQYQVEILDTEFLRFLDDEEDAPADATIVYHNFNIYKEDFNYMYLRPNVKMLKAEEVTGVDITRSLYNVNAGDDGLTPEEAPEAAEEETEMVYTGAETLLPGDVVGVYDGELLEDRAGVNGDVAYVKILSDLGGGRYLYGDADATEVADLPDTIVLPDDGSFEDGVIVVDASALDFSDPRFGILNLSANTVVDENDVIYFYSGDLAAVLDEGEETDAATTGIGRITSVEEAEGKATIHYEITTEEQVMASEIGDLYAGRMEVDIPLSEEEEEAIENEIARQMVESGFIDKSAEYLVALVMDENLENDLSETEYADLMQRTVFETEDGESLTLEEVRRMADGGKVKFEGDPNPTISLSSTLSHFKGNKGKKLTISYGFKITINLNEANGRQNLLVIKGKFTGEQEVMYYYKASFSKHWKKTKVLKIPYIYQYKFAAEFHVGSYTALGFTATVTTQSEPLTKDTPWGELLGGIQEKTGLDDNQTEKLANILELAEQREKKEKGTDVMASLPQKYSAFLKNGAEYITLFSKEICKIEVNLDSIGIVKFSMGFSFVFKMKINAMLGIGVSVGVAKGYSLVLESKDHNVSKNTWDIEEKNFKFNFFLFGMFGIRAGVLIDLRFGLISTSFDSVGLQGELGVYLEVYGFLWYEYTYSKSKGSNSVTKGALFIDIGIYFELSFYAQVGNGKISYRKNLYSNKWSLLSIGCAAYPIDFQLNKNDSRFRIELTDTNRSAVISSDVFNMQSMSMTNGSLKAISQDSNSKPSRGARSFRTADGKQYTQYDEANFAVTVRTTDKNGNTQNKNSFLYDPSNNTVHVLNQDGEFELWGEITFTYRMPGFAFSTSTMSRTVKVHWSGQTVDVPVYFRMKSFEGEKETTELLREMKVTGLKSGQTSFTLTKDMVDGWYKGSKLVSVVKTETVPAHYEVQYKEMRNPFGRPMHIGIPVWVPEDRVATVFDTKAGTSIPITLEEGNSIELLYQPFNTYINWTLYEPGTRESLAENEGYVPFGSRVEDVIPDNLKKGMDQYPDYPVKWVESRKAGNISATRPISIIGGNATRIEGTFQFARYHINWYDENKIYKEEELGWKFKIQPPEISRTGYTFKGWKRNDGEMLKEGDVMPDRDLKFYAQWEINSYDVSFILDNEVIQVSTVPYNGLISSISPVMKEEGYTVVWNTMYAFDGETLGEAQSVDENSRVPAYHIAVVGDWEANVHEVVWKSEDRVLERSSASYGELLSELVEPELNKEDVRQSFVGWSVERYDGNGERLMDSEMTMPDCSILITAKWEPRYQPIYWIVDARVEEEAELSPALARIASIRMLQRLKLLHVTRKLVGGQVLGRTEALYDVSADSLALPPENIPEGMTPVWDSVLPYADLSGYDPEKGITIKDYPSGISRATVPGGGLIVLGHLEANEHKVSWQVDSEEVASNVTYYGNPIPEVPEVEAKEGYHLEPWMVEDVLLTRFQPTMPDRDLTISSSWTINEHQVLWIVAGTDTRLVKNETLPYGSALTPPEVEEVAGYTLGAWQVDNRAITEGETLPDRDLVITAKRIPNQHLITWVSEGKTVKETIVNYGEQVAPLQGLTRHGYDLAGWTMEDGTAFETMEMPDEDLVLNAVWTPQAATTTWYGYDTREGAYTVLDANVPGSFGESLGTQIPERTLTYRMDDKYTYTLYTLPGALGEQELIQKRAAWEEVTDDTLLPPGASTFILKRDPVMVNITWHYAEDDAPVTTQWVGDLLAAPKEAVLEGHSFTGWADEEGTVYEYPPAQDATLYPQWEKTQYTVTWMSEGKEVKTDSVAYGDALPVPELTKTGYSLTNWKFGDEYVTEETTMPASDITCEAVWEVNYYTVTWVEDNVTVATTEVAYGDPITPPEIADRTGYSRSGWTWNGAALTGTETMPDYPITVTSIWSLISYTITWKSEGQVVNTETLAYGDALTPPEVSRTGYSLTGWKAGDSGSLPKTMPAGNVTAEAVWQINKYMVIWTVDGATEESELLEYGKPLKAPAPTRKHYTLSAWMNGGKELSSTDTVPDHEITLTASWIPNQHTVTWKDGSTTLDSATVSYGQTIPAGPDMDDKTGWDFKGWTYNGKKVTSKTSMPDEDITIEASWKQHTHQVFWVIGGDEVKRETVAYGDKLKPPTDTRTGYTRTEWKVGGQPLTDSFTMPDESVIVTANWELNYYTLTWSIDGSTISSSQMGYDMPLKAPVVDEREGFVLSDWELDGKTLESGARMPAKSVEIKASWVHNVHIWDEGKVTQKATCTKEGKLVKSCKYCNETQEIKLGIDPDNHTNIKTEKAKKATCGEDGYEGDTFCKDCGVLIKEGSSIPMTGAHTWGKKTVTRAATCLKEGVATQTCKTCGETLETAIPVDSTNHTHTTTVNKVTVSCFVDGYTGDVRCEDCGEIISRGEVVKSKMAHTWKASNVIRKATDTTPGLMEYTCEVCGQTKIESIPLETFLRTWEPAGTILAPASVEEGTVVLPLETLIQAAEEQGASTLSDLDPGRFFQACVGDSADESKSVGIRADISWGDDGSYYVESLTVGQTLKVVIKPEDPDQAEEAEATVTLVHCEHLWAVGAVTTQPTCKTEGKGTNICRICGAEGEAVTLPVNPESHSGRTHVIGKKEATAEEDGYTGDTICLDCGQIIELGEVIPKLNVPDTP